MPLTDDERDTLLRLQGRLQRDRSGSSNARYGRTLGFLELDAYYDGMQRLEQLGLAVPEELRRFVTIVNWPRVRVEAIGDRLEAQGFRLPGEQDTNDELSRIWQANDLDDETPQVFLDAMVFGRSYMAVGTNEGDDGTPLVTGESPLEMTHERDPRSRRVRAGAKFYSDGAGSTARMTDRLATLYLPGETVWCRQSVGGWVEEERDVHLLDYPDGSLRVPLEPFVNRSRLHKRYGMSEMADTIGLTDAAARALTNAQLATEIMAIPQRYVAGMSKGDFIDPNTGEMVPTWAAYFGAIWASGNSDAKFGQFSAADLSNFERIVNHYAQLVAGVSGLPLRFFGQLTTNPPSAEGIRADEARLVKTSERRCTSFGGSLERVQRLIMAFKDEDRPELANLETIWRNPATPTLAQSADAAVKMYAAHIISLRQARLDAGYSPLQIKQMEADDVREATDPTVERIARDLSTGLGGPTTGQPAPVDPTDASGAPPAA